MGFVSGPPLTTGNFEKDLDSMSVFTELSPLLVGRHWLSGSQLQP
jgi:hypothetical protein